MVAWDRRENRGRRDHKNRVRVTGARKDVGKYAFMRRTGKEWNELEGRVFENVDTVKGFRKKIEGKD